MAFENPQDRFERRNPFVSDASRAIRRKVKVARFHFMSVQDFSALPEEDREVLTADYQASLDAWLAEQNGAPSAA